MTQSIQVVLLTLWPPLQLLRQGSGSYRNLLSAMEPDWVREHQLLCWFARAYTRCPSTTPVRLAPIRQACQKAERYSKVPSEHHDQHRQCTCDCRHNDGSRTSVRLAPIRQAYQKAEGYS